MIKALKQHVRRLSVAGLIALFVVSALARIVSASLSTISETGAEPEYDRSALLCPPSDEVSTLLQQIAARSHELEARETDAALREQDLVVARQEIDGSLSRLAEAEDRLAVRMQQSSTASDEDIARLVGVYEGMKPKEAAVLFEAMEPVFAAGFIARMDQNIASSIFSNLSPDKAYALSVIMAGRNANAAKE